VDHCTELTVVQLVIAAGVKLCERILNLFLCQILADAAELLFGDSPIPVLVHGFEQLLTPI